MKDEKLKALAIEYITNKYKKVEALKSLGYSTNYAEHGGLKLFDNVRFKEILSELEAKKQAKNELKLDVSISEIVNELSSIAFSTNPLISKSDKLRALELLGKYKAMFTDKLMTDNTTTYNIPDNDKAILEDTSRELAIKLSKTA